DFGSDSGMPDTNEAGQYIFNDENLINGLDYRYYIAAYNVGSETQPPVENPPVTDPAFPDDNTVEVTPRSPLATTTLNNVKVVPNPYLSGNEFETDPNVRELHFTNLPSQCVIRIYNVAGELVAELQHRNGTSEESWNIRSGANQEVAPGLYFFYVSSKVISGEKVGKFLIIK
ncbi:MAG TPA: hypothetical protein VLB50_02750, partial [Ignavibacteriaceae bacterium]|nr:hypothetical protein [Ignavibacteriaceae bacterium]